MTEKEISDMYLGQAVKCIKAVSEAAKGYSSQIRVAAYTSLLVEEVRAQNFDDETRAYTVKRMTDLITQRINE